MQDVVVTCCISGVADAGGTVGNSETGVRKCGCPGYKKSLVCQERVTKNKALCGVGGTGFEPVTPCL